VINRFQFLPPNSTCAATPWVRDLEVAPKASAAERGEKSYPSMAVDADGLGVHLSYTYSSPGNYGHRQGLALVHFSAQPEPFLTQNTPRTPP